MGDRGNIVVRQGADHSDDVWFYTHWSGSEITDVVKRALQRRKRWDDGSYLARIIFCELVRPDAEGETGFGISCSLSENNNPIVVVDVPNQRVAHVPASFLIDGRIKSTLPDGQSFEEFSGK